jgi:hypothetical protein
VFNNERYVSKGVGAVIPAEVCAVLWAMIDALKVTGIEVSGYQFFTLSPQNEGQKIVHSQEQPDYTRDTTLPLNCSPVQERIYAIDNGEYSAMILSSEY